MITRFALLTTALIAAGCASMPPAPLAGATDLPRTSRFVSNWPACGVVEQFPDRGWEVHSRDEWDAVRLDQVEQLFADSGGAALMVVHRGQAVASLGDVATPYTAQSVRKGLVNALAGQMVGEGRIALDDTLADLGIDDDPPLTPQERTARFEDLLLSRSGIMHSALYEVGGWKRLRGELAERKLREGGFSPGEYWIYNNWDFNAVGTVLERAGGASIGDLFAARVAVPIGMQDFRAAHVEYTTRDHLAERHFDNRSDHRAYVFNISTRDLARYGLLYLNCGAWNGEQVVPREWVLASLDGVPTAHGRPADESFTGFGDYGYLWQIDRPSSRRYTRIPTRDPVYFATGSRGHLLMVAPYLDLVVAIQPATEGGVSAEAQQRRAIEGSPEIEDAMMEQLLLAIIGAHPQGGTALLDEG